MFGVEGRLIRVEADIAGGLPSFEMGGLLSSEIKESRERVRTAMKNSGFPLPPKRIAINFAPADQPKSGTGFDLPIAAVLMAAMELYPEKQKEKALFLGELGLSGEVRPVKGVLPILCAAREAGITRVYIPEGNLAEGNIWGDISVVGIRSLAHLVSVLTGKDKGNIRTVKKEPLIRDIPDFSQVAGMQGARRAAEIAAAGMHNLLLIGPPGSGKTMLASRIPGILPSMDREEQIEATKIYSSRGLLTKEGLLEERPFRQPHHTITKSAMAGGGLVPKAGEITLAHKGVLFLDELPEFHTEVLEILRQPLEERKLTISRNRGTYTFPAEFMLVAAMNPCKCGFYPDRSRCLCSEREVRKYLNRVSRPLLDRFDLYVEVPAVKYEQLRNRRKAESSEKIRNRVEAARKRQKERLSYFGLSVNAQMGERELERFCMLGKEEEAYLKKLFETLHFSARAYGRVLKIARTIADLDGERTIEIVHLKEAAGYRRAAENYWGGQL